ncbi:MAG: CO dehydrogenase nickel-insertion accessory protein CooC1 [Candidatus Alkanophagales archaeon MCA70_species_1]|nr:CO dehydrogenase nickel-insertion accessory protein CooC1 [Candidatus Alkanophaga volatiphilum]
MVAMQARGVKIAISGKGGVGKTTLAGTLARALARDGYEVIAIDADPAMNLASALGVSEVPTPISELKDLIYERTGGYGGVYKLNPKVDDVVAKYSAVAPDGVRLIVMGTVEKGGGGCVCPENAFLRALLRHVIFRGKVVILDMEAGIEHLGRGTARGVDLMLAVVEPGMRSVETAKRIKKLAADIGVNDIAAIINKASDEAVVETLRSKLEQELRIPVIGVIPYDETLIRADMEGKAPIDVGGEAVERIYEIKEKIFSYVSLG